MDFDFKNLNPYVRYSYINTNAASANTYKTPLYAYDHRLFYVLEGKITAKLDGKEDITLNPGDCLVLEPAHGYRMIPKVGGTRFVITSFDFDNEHIGIRSRHPDEKENFSKDDVISAYKPDYFDKMLVCTGAISLREKLKEICSAMVWQEEYKYDYASSLFKGVLIELYRLVTIKEKLKYDSELSFRVKNYADSRFCDNLTNETVGAHFGYHPHYINKVFKEAVGCTLHSYVIDKRVDMAKGLLINSSLALCEVAAMCGFASSTYFSECFKARTGLSPKDFRQMNR